MPSTQTSTSLYLTKKSIKGQLRRVEYGLDAFGEAGDSLESFLFPFCCCQQGKVSLISRGGVRELQYLIFELALFHSLSCLLTFGLGMAKVRKIHGPNLVPTLSNNENVKFVDQSVDLR